MVIFIKVNLNKINMMEKEFTNSIMVTFIKVNINNIKRAEEEF